jgi:hypothetical protein
MSESKTPRTDKFRLKLRARQESEEFERSLELESNMLLEALTFARAFLDSDGPMLVPVEAAITAAKKARES